MQPTAIHYYNNLGRRLPPLSIGCPWHGATARIVQQWKVASASRQKRCLAQEIDLLAVIDEGLNNTLTLVLGVASSLIAFFVIWLGKKHWLSRTRDAWLGLKLGVHRRNLKVREDTLTSEVAGELLEGGRDLLTFKQRYDELAELARTNLLKLDPAELNKRLSVTVHPESLLNALDEVALTTLDSEFYPEFKSRAFKAKSRMTIVGEGVIADKADEQRLMEEFVDVQRQLTRSQVTVVRIQTRALISAWWCRVLESLFDAGTHDNTCYFKLYFGPTQFTFPCVIDQGESATRCVEVMMPIGEGAFDEVTGGLVERAGVGLFLKGQLADKPAAHLIQKIERTTRFAMSVDEYQELLRPYLDRRNAGEEGPLTRQELAVLDAVVRIENKTQLRRFYDLTGVFRGRAK